jgi:hypothetical protein
MHDQIAVGGGVARRGGVRDQPLLDEVGSEQSGEDGVDADAEGADLQSQRSVIPSTAYLLAL